MFPLSARGSPSKRAAPWKWLLHIGWSMSLVSDFAAVQRAAMRRHRAVTSRLFPNLSVSFVALVLALSIAVAQEFGHHDARLCGGPRRGQDAGDIVPPQATPLRFLGF